MRQQARLEADPARAGRRDNHFLNDVIAHAERLCERVAIIAAGPFDGRVTKPRTLSPLSGTYPGKRRFWRPRFADARREGEEWVFNSSGRTEPRWCTIDGGAGRNIGYRATGAPRGLCRDRGQWPRGNGPGSRHDALHPPCLHRAPRFSTTVLSKAFIFSCWRLCSRSSWVACSEGSALARTQTERPVIAVRAAERSRAAQYRARPRHATERTRVIVGFSPEVPVAPERRLASRNRRCQC